MAWSQAGNWHDVHAMQVANCTSFIVSSVVQLEHSLLPDDPDGVMADAACASEPLWTNESLSYAEQCTPDVTQPESACVVLIGIDGEVVLWHIPEGGQVAASDQCEGLGTEMGGVCRCSCRAG